MIRSGAWSLIARSAASPLASICDLPIAGPLERVLDEPGDVLLVFDHQNAR